MMVNRLALAALVAALALSACGVKGDPLRPGQKTAHQEKVQKKTTVQSTN